MMDKLAGSQYTHEQVFHLEATFAYSLMLSRYEAACYRERAEDAKHKLGAQ